MLTEEGCVVMANKEKLVMPDTLRFIWEVILIIYGVLDVLTSTKVMTSLQITYNAVINIL